MQGEGCAHPKIYNLQVHTKIYKYSLHEKNSKVAPLNVIIIIDLRSLSKENFSEKSRVILYL